MLGVSLEPLGVLVLRDDPRVSDGSQEEAVVYKKEEGDRNDEWQDRRVILIGIFEQNCYFIGNQKYECKRWNINQQECHEKSPRLRPTL